MHVITMILDQPVLTVPESYTLKPNLQWIDTFPPGKSRQEMERRLWPTDSLAGTRGHWKCCRFSYSRQRKNRLSRALILRRAVLQETACSYYPLR